MAIDCLNPPCSPQLPISSIVSVFGTPPQNTNSDCSMNLLYLTDEAGLVNQATAGSAPMLSTTNRTLQIASASQVDLHFSPCSRLYWELKKFFSWETGALQRPPTITLGYFDSADETMVEALAEIDKCFTCYRVVTHTLYDKDDVALFDTTESVDLAEWATLQKTKLAVIPTVDYATTAGQLLSNAYDYSTSALLNEVCVHEKDADCEDTDTLVNTYDINHLGLASVLTSISSSSSNYAFTVKFTPKNYAFSNLATSQFSLADTRTATGVDPYAGGVNPNSPHYTNVYHNVGGTPMYMEGLTSTGRYVDELMHKIHIKETLERDIFALFNSNASVGMSDLSKLQNVLSITVRNLVSQGLISNAAGSLSVESVLKKTGLIESNVYLKGNGWVILNYTTTPANINSRISPTFIICYVRPGSVHFASIGLCQSEIEEVS